MKILGLDLKSNVDRLKFIILLSGFLIFAVVALGVSYKVTSSPGFCSMCHTMAPEYATWQASSHSQVSCTECHIEPGFENIVKQKVSGLGHLYKQASGEFYLPVRQIMPISSEVCLKCHNLERDFSPGGDLIIPHETHYKKKVSCTRCHSGVAHGNIAQRRATITGSLSDWDLAKGKEQMQPQFTKTPMDDCMKCHARRSAPLDCSACHKTSKEPLSHNKPSFISTHGKEALVELNSCNLCHGYSGYASGSELKVEKKQKGLVSERLLLPGKVRPATEVVDYSRKNAFCVNCHSQKPKNHEVPAFANYHANEGKKSSGKCFTCHSNRSEELNPVTKTTCSTCHPSSHAKRDWKSTHPIDVKGKKLNQSCFSCHSSENCTSCHTLLRPKVPQKQVQVNPIPNENLNPNMLETFE